ncbi:hypothetical protein ABPG75_008252 [Micractinium tetrahymenae]
MLYLHSRSPPIIHKDLKGPNVLVADGWHVKVADFNLSKTLEENLAGQAGPGGTASGSGDDTTSQPVASNPRWLAPELILGGRATTASDVYAFGCVLYEMLTWQLPWQGESQYPNVGQVLAGKRPPVPPAAQLPSPAAGAWTGLPAYLALMEACWAQEPGQRPRFTDIVPSLWWVSVWQLSGHHCLASPAALRPSSQVILVG